MSTNGLALHQPQPSRRKAPNQRARNDRNGLMAAPRLRTPISLAQIHQVTGGELIGSPEATIMNLASLSEARSTDLSFVTGDRLLKTRDSIQAGALLVHRRLPELRCPHIVLANPLLGFARVAQTFFCPPVPPRGVAASTVRACLCSHRVSTHLSPLECPVLFRNTRQSPGWQCSVQSNSRARP